MLLALALAPLPLPPWWVVRSGEEVTRLTETHIWPCTLLSIVSLLCLHILWMQPDATSMSGKAGQSILDENTAAASDAATEDAEGDGTRTSIASPATRSAGRMTGASDLVFLAAMLVTVLLTAVRRD